MKRTLFRLAVLLAIFSVNCSPAPVTQEEAKRNISIAVQERTQILLDNKVPGVAISLTKNFYFVFDGSGSMREGLYGSCSGDQSFPTKMEGAKWAVRELMKKVPLDVNLGLYVFDWSGEREVISLGSNNHQNFLKAVDEISASGGTPLAEAIRFGTNQLVKQYQKQLGYGEYRLIVVTDGLADDIPDASLNAIKYGIPIYAIGLCIGNDHPLRQYALSYKAADSAEDLRRGLEETMAELPSFDVKEFKPLNNNR